MIFLHVNIDHVATIRQARQGVEPDPVTAASLAELGGAHGITVHLREDRRHIQDRDVRLLKEIVQTKLNLEMAATPEMFKIATALKPDLVTLVPEKRQEITTEGGLDVVGQIKFLRGPIQDLQQAGIRVSLFIDPQSDQIQASQSVGAKEIELHTGAYAQAKQEHSCELELNRLRKAAELAHQFQLQVNAGHGLNYFNVQKICSLPHLRELNIGHSIVSRAVFVGFRQAVQEMIQLLQSA